LIILLNKQNPICVINVKQYEEQIKKHLRVIDFHGKKKKKAKTAKQKT